MIKSTNRLLASLPDADYQRIAPHLSVSRLTFRRTLVKEAEPVTHVYFPNSATCCLIKKMRNGQTVEIATVGNEGVIGAHAFFGQRDSIVECVVRAPGEAGVLSVDVFMSEMGRHSSLFNAVIRYNQALTNQIVQTTACYGLHSATERCCRWLLFAHDRGDGEALHLTHDFVAAMLAIRRPTVSIVFATLQNAGAIRYTRGRIVVLDRMALERASCECYHAINTTLSRLLLDFRSHAIDPHSSPVLPRVMREDGHAHLDSEPLPFV